jgi:hypothetical protein
MKKIFLGVVFGFGLLFLLSQMTIAFVQSSPKPSPLEASAAAQKVDYILVYPGILPDHPLYSLKMIRDRILEFLTRDTIKRAELFVLFADKRLGAARALIEGGKADLGATTIAKAEIYLERAIDQASLAKQEKKEMGDLFDKLEKSQKKHIEVIEELLIKAPDSAQPGLKSALKKSQESLERVISFK